MSARSSARAHAGRCATTVTPGELVILDQLVDRTWGRPDTFADGGVVEHLTFADPYSNELAPVLADAARAEGATVHEGGTVVVVNGPRFSTRAESQWFRQMGWDVVNMTQYPEVALCRELGMAYAGLALVTDYDTGGVGAAMTAPVTIDEVFKVLAANVELTRPRACTSHPPPSITFEAMRLARTPVPRILLAVGLALVTWGYARSQLSSADARREAPVERPVGRPGLAALLPAGTRGLSIPRADGTPPLERGQRADLVAGGRVVVANALVVHVDEDGATVAVPADVAPAIADVVASGLVVLALAG